MTKKRYIKLLMAEGMDRNTAQNLAYVTREMDGRYPCNKPTGSVLVYAMERVLDQVDIQIKTILKYLQ